MKSVVIIPSRMASTRLPGKPLMEINGIPMIQRVWQQAIESNIGEVFVACSEIEVHDLIVSNGGKAIMTDPNLPSGTDRVHSAFLKIKNNKDIDIIINLQGDMPLINPEHILKVIDPIKRNFAIGTLATNLNDNELNNPNVTKVEVDFKKNEIAQALSFYREVTIENKNGLIKDGSSAYIKKIIKGFESKINLSSPIRTVSRLDNGIEIETANSKKPLMFDAVVFATHSDQALGMLKDPTEKEKDILSSIPYQKNEVLLHTDSSVLPKRKLAWASWNYQLDSNPESPVVLTYNMNILQSLDCDETFCVTLNDHQSVDKSKVLKKITYHHPLFTVKGIEAQKRKLEISGVNNTYYCGAYWHNGFHEDGVASAIEVCKHFGEQI